MTTLPKDYVEILVDRAKDLQHQILKGSPAPEVDEFLEAFENYASLVRRMTCLNEWRAAFEAHGLRYQTPSKADLALASRTLKNVDAEPNRPSPMEDVLYLLERVLGKLPPRPGTPRGHQRLRRSRRLEDQRQLLLAFMG